MYEICQKKILAPGIKLMDIKAPDVARKVQAGQFIILRTNEYGERIPLTVADFDREKGLITIIFQEVGYSTQELGKMEEGQFLLDFVGPLGRPTEIQKFGTVVCVGGGVGIAPVYPIARALKKAGNKVISIIGARSKELLILEEEMKAVSGELLVATDDGTYGHHGFVTDLLKEILDQGEIHRIWGIGPVMMMKAVAETTRATKITTLVSMNPIMVDGTGMCGACRLSVGDETKFACVDGPEFDGHLVDWELAIRRSAIFKEEEKIALEKGKCGGGCGCH
ncbi:MAG TPA: sulfide/dihydroorotate dehydrogenase-like FAD/NAD-binding protein [Clostridia bacterium]|nr:sulfide/dihydroorotate dehydrogenase-like FAD/NAD-binding protein [Clostridia bacterium]